METLGLRDQTETVNWLKHDLNINLPHDYVICRVPFIFKHVVATSLACDKNGISQNIKGMRQQE